MKHGRRVRPRSSTAIWLAQLDRDKTGENLAEEGRSVYTASWNQRIETEISVKETLMISETLLRALQERMRKLSEASSGHAVHDAELRAAVERARLTDASETAREAAAVSDCERLLDEIKELRDHINDLSRSREDPVLVSGLKEELTELELDPLKPDRPLKPLPSAPRTRNAVGMQFRKADAGIGEGR